MRLAPPLRVSAVVPLFLLLASAPPAAAADWPMFRGPDRNGVAPADATAPLHWSAEQSVKWKAPLPRPGNSSPIVVGDCVFVTCALDAQGTKRGLFCFGRADGKQRWVQTVAYDKFEKTHATNPYCGSTPASDGQRVIAWHGSAGLHCYDLDGKPLWSRDLGTFTQIWGYASSPIIHGEVVYLNAGPGDRQRLVALDKNTGEVRWTTEEPGGADDKSAKTGGWLGSWSTPVVMTVSGREQVLVFMPFHVNAYGPKTGSILWTAEGAGPLAYTDVLLGPAGADGARTAVAMAGYGGAAIGFKLPAAGDVVTGGDVPAANRLWLDAGKHPQRIGSGVVVGQHVFVPNEPNLACYELATGKEAWHQQPGGQFWAPLLAVGDRLYAVAKDGTTYVFAADPTGYKQLAKNPLGEDSNSTPAVSDGQLFIRTAGHLWCVE